MFIQIIWFMVRDRITFEWFGSGDVADAESEPADFLWWACSVAGQTFHEVIVSSVVEPFQSSAEYKLWENYTPDWKLGGKTKVQPKWASPRLEPHKNQRNFWTWRMEEKHTLTHDGESDGFSSHTHTTTHVRSQN